MARLPKYLNMSVAGKAKLALPTARLALVAFSCTLAIVGMGAFVATLPGLSAQDANSGGAAAPALASEGTRATGASGTEEAQTDGVATEEGASAEGDAAATSDGSMGTSPSVGMTLTPPATMTGNATSGSASGSGASGGSSSGSGGGAAASGGSSSGSNASGSSSSSGSGGSNSNSGSSSSSSSSGEGSIDHSDPFYAIPTEADEAEFHNFLVTWYNRLASAEADAAARDGSSADAGFTAVSNRVRSNYSKWCSAQENLIGAYRCLYDYACTGSQSCYDEYLSWKSRVSL